MMGGARLDHNRLCRLLTMCQHTGLLFKMRMVPAVVADMHTCTEEQLAVLAPIPGCHTACRADHA